MCVYVCWTRDVVYLCIRRSRVRQVSPVPGNGGSEVLAANAGAHGHEKEGGKQRNFRGYRGGPSSRVEAYWMDEYIRYLDLRLEKRRKRGISTERTIKKGQRGSLKRVGLCDMCFGNRGNKDGPTRPTNPFLGRGSRALRRIERRLTSYPWP